VTDNLQSTMSGFWIKPPAISLAMVHIGLGRNSRAIWTVSSEDWAR
jgi:hypothetical protein